MSATHLSILGSVCALLFVPVQRCAAEESQPLTMKCLLRMGRCELEALYRDAPAAPILDGYCAGLAIRRPGGKLARPCSSAAGLIWKGKQFCAEAGTLINRWAGGLEAVEAHVYSAESWVDGKPALIMDYRGSSPVVWRNVRDELREIASGLYLGVMVHDRAAGPKVGQFFALEAR